MRRKIRRVTPTLTAVLLILTGSRDLWLSSIGRYLIVGDPLEPADALVPLAGERLRVFYAADLFQKGYARWFVITDMWLDRPKPAVSYTDSVSAQAIERGVPTDRILVAPGQAASTYREALNLRWLAEQQDWHSLIVVTSPYHTRRARMIFGEVFGDTNITVMIQPVHEHWYRAEDWWTSWMGWQVTVAEYLKLGLYLIGYHQLVNS
jgi:uncharacterized SAM-binding protein YcdF (DUF218 family)